MFNWTRTQIGLRILITFLKEWGFIGSKGTIKLLKMSVLLAVRVTYLRTHFAPLVAILIKNNNYRKGDVLCAL